MTWYFLWGIYTSIPTWNHSQNLLAAAEAQSLKISPHRGSFKWSWRLSQSARDVIRYAMKWDILLRAWWKLNADWDNNTIRIPQRREGHCRINTSVRRERYIQRAGLWESQSGIQVEKLTICVRSLEIEKL